MIITHITDFTCSAVNDIDGVEHRKAYSNTPESRAEFIQECIDAEGFDDVLVVWGDTPVIIPITDSAPHEPTQEERTDALEAAMLEMIMMQVDIPFVQRKRPFFVSMMRQGKITLEDVPIKWRADVAAQTEEAP